MLLSSIRQQILDRAIRGQLVPQRPEEGTAEELYQQIQAEKKALIANGTIKKEKPLEPIQEEDIPFEIPATWKWVKLGEVGSTNIGLTYTPKDISPNGTIVLRSCNIFEGKMKYEDIVRVKTDIPKNQMCDIGDILICARNGSKRLVGKAAIIDKTGMSFGAFMAIYRSICNPYILHFINSTHFKDTLMGESGTTTINQLTQDILKNFLVPLPPLPEQNRIVQKIEALFSALDTVESSKKRISAIQTELTKRILEQAIQGKLVPQLLEEGTAEELYQQIQAEKQRLIAAGTIKKEKPLPPIEEKDIPFDIPETWKWVRLGDVCHILFSGKPPQYDKVNKHHPCLGQAANQIEGIRMSEAKYVTSAFYNTVPEYQKLRFGDVLLNTLGGGTIGRSGIFNIQDTDIITDGHIFVFRMFDLCTAQYLLAYLRHNLDSIIKGAEGSTNQTFLKKSEVLNYVFPLPPLTEQKRIVAKIEEMLTLCKTLQ